jgi:hypothetical protein
MATDVLQLSAPEPMPIRDAGVEFEIREDGAPLGRLRVTNAGLAWQPPFGSTAKMVGWSEFTDWMLG